MTPLKLETPLAEIHALAGMVDGRGSTRKVAKDTLSKLLVDHNRMVARLMSEGVKVEG